MKRIDDDAAMNNFELSTGRRFSANCEYIGIARRSGQWSISEGYDGHIYVDAGWSEDDADRWTPAEKAELADYMIALWQEFRDSLGQESRPATDAEFKASASRILKKHGASLRKLAEND